MELTLNIDAEVAALAQTLAAYGDGQRQAVEGACWALGRVTNQPAETLYARVRQHAMVLVAAAPPAAPPVAVAPSPGSVPSWREGAPPPLANGTAPAPMPTVVYGAQPPVLTAVPAPERMGPPMAGAPQPGIDYLAPPAAPPPAPAAPPPSPLGDYPGLGPITQLPVEPPAADLSKPPAPPDPNSMALLNEAATATGEPITLPMDPDTLAEVDAEMEAARLAYRGFAPDG